MRISSPICLGMLLFACLLVPGCDRSEGLRLVGTWEGTPAEGAIGVDEQEPAIESCRFEFGRMGDATITLRVKGQPERTAQARWQVVKSGLERLTVLVSLPQEGDEAPRTTQLELEFEGPDRIVASEVGGDYRVPAMNLVREGSAVAEGE